MRTCSSLGSQDKIDPVDLYPIHCGAYLVSSKCSQTVGFPMVSVPSIDTGWMISVLPRCAFLPTVH
jgi:hypothetical protein